jgi:hypothetical protein
MEGHKSRATHHIFKGETDGRAAAEWLNRNSGTKECREVIHIIDGIRKLTPNIPPSLFKFFADKESSRSRYVVALNKLNQRLVKYAMWPMFLGRSTQVRRWGKNRSAEARTKFRWKWSHGYNPATPIVHCIARLGVQGFFSRLRQCTLCTNWYYARFGHQLFCSTRCREKRFKSTPEWRAMRREYMRKHRQDLRDRAVREISFAKL